MHQQFLICTFLSEYHSCIWWLGGSDTCVVNVGSVVLGPSAGYDIGAGEARIR
jgi:hypothetical protein